MLDNGKNNSFDVPEGARSGEGINSTHFAIGIDIGTTTISVAVVDLESKRICESLTESNAFRVKCDHPAFALQDAEAIACKVKELADQAISKYGNVSVIGFTGQMHGIVYLNENGRAISPLATWQDQRGALPFASEDRSYCDELSSISGERISTGYGFATHFYNVRNKLVPDGACSFCSIMDYTALCLTGKSKPLIHTSVAASFGLFNLEKQSFLEMAQNLMVDGLELPELTNDFSILGYYREIPVSVAIGDNQASFLGSVKSLKSSVLVNIGTGSQITAMSELCRPPEGCELRPLVKDSYLLCASALCGGSSYALLEGFFGAYSKRLTGDSSSQYGLMNELAGEAFYEGCKPPRVETTFLGTRICPAKRGVISDITPENFTPKGFVLGFLYGICQELRELFPWELCGGKLEVVASGGAVRRIDVMREIIKDVFGLPVSLSDGSEEAAIGAALFGAVANGALSGIDDFSQFFK